MQEGEDCDEKDHTWERFRDGTWLCIWCDAKVKKVGRRAKKTEAKVAKPSKEEADQGS